MQETTTTPSGLILVRESTSPPPESPAMATTRQLSELTDRIYTTPCPRCGGEMDFTEDTIGLISGRQGPLGIWSFCNAHTFPRCKAGCGQIPFAEVIPPPPEPPAMTDRQRRSELNGRICATPCPRCGGEMDFSENTIGSFFMLPGPQGVWSFCNTHTHPYCKEGCGQIPFAEVIPPPA